MATLNNTAYTTNPLLRDEGSSPISDAAGIGRMYEAKGTRAPQSTVSSPTQPVRESIADTYARGQSVLAGLPPLPGATTPTKEPTIAESLGPLTYEKNPTFEEIYGKPEDEDAIRRQQLKLFQGQIDATNTIYDQMLNQARMEGQGRLGSQRAMAARGGLLGSDFGASQKEKVIGYNNDINRAIQAERLAKVGEIMGEVRSAVTAQLAEKRAARQQGAENYLSYLKNESTTRQGNLNLAASAMLSRGIDPTTIDENELAAIAKEAGVSTTDLITQYRTLANEQASATAESDLKTRKTEAEIAKIEADIASGKLKVIGEGTMLYNTETGETFKNPKTYAPGTGSSSSLDLTGDGKRTLLGGGWTESEISSLQEGVKQYGLQTVIQQEKAAGATASQIAALEKAYKASGEDGNVFLTADYFKSLFGDEKLAKAAKEAGTVTGGNDYIPFNERGDTETYVKQLMSTVELYRQAGYTDQEILKMMQ